MIDEQCENCRFMMPHDKTLTGEECRRRAPIFVTKTNGYGEVYSTKGWPKVSLGDWCGEWEQGDEEIKKGSKYECNLPKRELDFFIANKIMVWKTPEEYKGDYNWFPDCILVDDSKVFHEFYEGDDIPKFTEDMNWCKKAEEKVYSTTNYQNMLVAVAGDDYWKGEGEFPVDAVPDVLAGATALQRCQAMYLDFEHRRKQYETAKRS